ncbi:MAG: DUF4026 domain-containing protein, partial [Oscillospiraceae bacterium]|nr:DUF4026 domain-containing protein [Oscillospiraceae bacterium]
KRSGKYGFSLRTYYMKQASFWLEIDREKTDVAYANFQHYPRSKNSDCEACELNFSMRVHLLRDDEEKALEIIQPVLRHEKKCGEIPHVTYAYLAEYYFLHDNPAEAMYYANLCENLIHGKPEFLRETGKLLEIYSVLDVNQGWKLLKYSLEHFMQCHNPKMRMLFARGAWKLMQSISEQLEFVQSPLLGVLPVAPSGDGWSVEEVSSFFYEIAHDIAEKLDKRNGISCYVPALGTPLPEYDAETTFEKITKSVRGIVRKSRTTMAIFLNQKISQDELEQRIQKAEILYSSRDEDACYASIRTEETVLDLIFSADVSAPPLEGAPVQGMEEEQIQALLESPSCCVLAAELSGTPQKTYYAILKFLNTLFPEMNGLINLTALKAYPAEWVRFAGTYEDAVSAHDLYSVYLSGSQETGEVWGTTIGLCAFGLRELEFMNADTENFGNFAGIMDKLSAGCLERNTLPDENQVISHCRNEETREEFEIKWQNPETALKDANPESIAVSVGREMPSGILNLHTIPELEKIELPLSRRDTNRRIRLAEQTLLLFQNALKQPFAKALVRIGIPLSEEMQERYDYEIEPLWAEVQPDGKILLLETSETLPEYQEGDAVNAEISAETIYDWRIQPDADDGMISPEDAYLLKEERA